MSLQNKNRKQKYELVLTIFINKANNIFLGKEWIPYLTEVVPKDGMSLSLQLLVESHGAVRVCVALLRLLDVTACHSELQEYKKKPNKYARCF